jgi:hypothetical protein
MTHKDKELIRTSENVEEAYVGGKFHLDNCHIYRLWETTTRTDG